MLDALREARATGRYMLWQDRDDAPSRWRVDSLSGGIIAHQEEARERKPLDVRRPSETIARGETPVCLAGPFVGSRGPVALEHLPGPPAS